MKSTQSVDHVVIRFAGDSGDGMQIVGSQFTNTTALLGNDLATFPDFPAEIRAPAGTLAGVSGFQLHFANHDIFTPGDSPEALVAMNPAALKANIDDLKPGGLVIVNQEKFIDREFEKCGITSNPLDDGSLAAFRVVPVDLARHTREAVEGLGLSGKETERCKNFYALSRATARTPAPPPPPAPRCRPSSAWPRRSAARHLPPGRTHRRGESHESEGSSSGLSQTSGWM